MRRPRSRIGAELALIGLVLVALGGSLFLVIAAHRRSAAKKPVVPVAVALAPIVSDPVPQPTPESEPDPAPAPPPLPPPEDPTPGVIAPLTVAEVEQREAATQADLRAEAIEEARREAEAESGRWTRRESLVRGQLDSLDARAAGFEAQAAAIETERDALARRRDLARRDVDQAQHRPGSAILPHKGPNGTWRRPIAIECRDGQAILQPRGLAFGLLDLSDGFSRSSNPFVKAVIREAVRLQGATGPDGSPVVPYIFFLIRPDGIRPYYEARARLEPLSISFGYELIEFDMAVDFPDLDDASTWDGSAPSRKGTGTLAGGRPANATGRGPGRESRSGGSSRDDEFVWTMPQLGRFSRPEAPRGPADEPGSLMPPLIGTGVRGDQPGSLHPPGAELSDGSGGLEPGSIGEPGEGRMAAGPGPMTIPMASAKRLRAARRDRQPGRDIRAESPRPRMVQSASWILGLPSSGLPTPELDRGENRDNLATIRTTPGPRPP